MLTSVSSRLAPSASLSRSPSPRRTNMEFRKNYNQLRANDYAPAPIPKGHSTPPGAWSVLQIDFSKGEFSGASAALLCAIPAARGTGANVVADSRSTWLAVLTFNCGADLSAGLQAIVARYT